MEVIPEFCQFPSTKIKEALKIIKIIMVETVQHRERGKEKEYMRVLYTFY